MHFWLKELNVRGVEDNLPVFDNLKYLELDNYTVSNCWDKVVLAFLNHSRVLETLVFLEVSLRDLLHFCINFTYV